MSPPDQDGALGALRRAFDDAFTRPAAAAPPATGSLLVVRAGDRRVALPLSHVAGIVACPALTRVPRGSAALLGVGGVRGRLVAFFCLAEVAGGDAAGAAAPTRWAALLASDRTLALAFDALEGRLPAPALPEEGDAGGPLRVADVGGASCVILDAGAWARGLQDRSSSA